MKYNPQQQVAVVLDHTAAGADAVRNQVWLLPGKWLVKQIVLMGDLTATEHGSNHTVISLEIDEVAVHAWNTDEGEDGTLTAGEAVEVELPAGGIILEAGSVIQVEKDDAASGVAWAGRYTVLAEQMALP